MSKSSNPRKTTWMAYCFPGDSMNQKFGSPMTFEEAIVFEKKLREEKPAHFYCWMKYSEYDFRYIRSFESPSFFLSV